MKYGCNKVMTVPVVVVVQQTDILLDTGSVADPDVSAFFKPSDPDPYALYEGIIVVISFFANLFVQ